MATPSNEVLSSVTTLKNPKTEIHLKPVEVNNFSCYICEITCKTKASVKRHLEKYHAIDKENINEKKISKAQNPKSSFPPSQKSNKTGRQSIREINVHSQEFDKKSENKKPFGDFQSDLMLKVIFGVPKESIRDNLISCKTAPKTRPKTTHKLGQANRVSPKIELDLAALPKSRSGKRARDEEIHEISEGKISKIVKIGALCSCCPSTSSSSKSVH
jgi:hypothetical protein